jgi:asparagine synthase (glutamine-hydrolysing)
MCGINGTTFGSSEVVRRMNEATQHRGPDGMGVFSDGRIAIGHNLLSIMETPANGAQPVVSECFVLAFNGEIYNYRILRDELYAQGDRFRTDSDTEVIFAGLARFGPSFLSRLDGMYAIAWYDRSAGILFLARDRSGVKPLYIHRAHDRIAFSSEIRGLLAGGVPAMLDHDAAGLYFALGYVPGSATLFRTIEKVCPGQYLRINIASGDMQRHWLSPEIIEMDQRPADLRVVRDTIGESVLAHTMGLRPFGMYLSGGMDSTIILHEVSRRTQSKVMTYTTRFDVTEGPYNEDADLAARLTRDYNIEHHELLVRESDFVDAFPAATRTIEEPRWNFSIPTYWLLAQKASKDITVVLNGAGGDELFLGYAHYNGLRRMDERYRRLGALWASLVYTAKYMRRGKIKTPTLFDLRRPLDRWVYTRSFRTPAFRGRETDCARVRHYIRSIGYPEVVQPLPDVENAVGSLDRLLWLADEEFLRTDKIAMHFGMEGRFPLVGDRVVRLANRIPGAQKLSHERAKIILRDAYKGYLPDYIIGKRKTGWRSPVDIWMRSRFGSYVREVLSADYYPEMSGLFDFSAIHRDHLHAANAHTQLGMKLYIPIFSFLVWAREFGVRL